MRYTTPAMVRSIYRSRPKRVHKGMFGRLLVVSGSRRFTGSPIFVSMSAYRAGCDLVFIAAPERAADVAAGFSPNLITEPLEGDFLAPGHLPQIRKLVEEVRPTAMVIGPALWREKETFMAIVKLIQDSEIPMVIDADAIRAVAAKPSVLKGKAAVLTPHANEFLALTGQKAAEELTARAEAVRYWSLRMHTVILLKGHVDAASDGKSVLLNRTGTPYMTKGGMGDTLAGICGALLGRGVAPLEAAAAAAYINGKAGELASREKGEGVLATDLIEKIQEVLPKR